MLSRRARVKSTMPLNFCAHASPLDASYYTLLSTSLSPIASPPLSFSFSLSPLCPVFFRSLSPAGGSALRAKDSTDLRFQYGIEFSRVESIRRSARTFILTFSRRQVRRRPKEISRLYMHMSIVRNDLSEKEKNTLPKHPSILPLFLSLRASRPVLLLPFSRVS